MACLDTVITTITKKEHDEEGDDEEGHDEEEEAPPVLDLEMTRFDLEGELLDPVRG